MLRGRSPQLAAKQRRRPDHAFKIRVAKSAISCGSLGGRDRAFSIVSARGAEGRLRLLADRRQVVKLLRLGGARECGGRGGAARDDVLHLVEVAGADEALVLCGGVAVLTLAFKLRFLQSGIGAHALELVFARKFEHAVVQRMETRKRDELEFVAHRAEFTLEARNLFAAEMLPPVEGGRAVVGEQLPGILRVDGLGKLACLLEIRLGCLRERRRSPPRCAHRSKTRDRADRYRWSEEWHCRHPCAP